MPGGAPVDQATKTAPTGPGDAREWARQRACRALGALPGTEGAVFSLAAALQGGLIAILGRSVASRDCGHKGSLCLQYVSRRDEISYSVFQKWVRPQVKYF
jgi:hypothetical protein